jgi:REP element-mobilizing transposase RayT
MLIFQQGFIAKKLKGRSSRILREEFPHLKDWCGEQLWRRVVSWQRREWSGCREEKYFSS